MARPLPCYISYSVAITNALESVKLAEEKRRDVQLAIVKEFCSHSEIQQSLANAQASALADLLQFYRQRQYYGLSDSAIVCSVHFLFFSFQDAPLRAPFLQILCDEVILPLKHTSLSRNLQESLLWQEGQLTQLNETALSELCTHWVRCSQHRDHLSFASAELLSTLAENPLWQDRVFSECLHASTNIQKHPNSARVKHLMYDVCSNIICRLNDCKEVQRFWEVLLDRLDFSLLIPVINVSFEKLSDLQNFQRNRKIWEIVFWGVSDAHEDKITYKHSVEILFKLSAQLMNGASTKSDGLMWKKYHSILDTVSFETDKNLIHEAWLRVGSLFPEVGDGTELPGNAASVPEMSFEWISFILTRGVRDKYHKLGRFERISSILDGSVWLPLDRVSPEWLTNQFLPSIDKRRWFQPGIQSEFVELLRGFLRKFIVSQSPSGQKTLLQLYFSAASNSVPFLEETMVTFLSTFDDSLAEVREKLTSADVEAARSAYSLLVCSSCGEECSRLLVRCLMKFMDALPVHAMINFVGALREAHLVDSIHLLSRALFSGTAADSDARVASVVEWSSVTLLKFVRCACRRNDVVTIFRVLLLTLIHSHRGSGHSTAAKILQIFSPVSQALCELNAGSKCDEALVSQSLIVFQEWVLSIQLVKKCNISIPNSLYSLFRKSLLEVEQHAFTNLQSSVQNFQMCQLHEEDLSLTSVESIGLLCDGEERNLFDEYISKLSAATLIRFGEIAVDPVDCPGKKEELLHLLSVMICVYKNTSPAHLEKDIYGEVQRVLMLSKFHVAYSDADICEKRWQLVCHIARQHNTSISLDAVKIYLRTIIDELPVTSRKHFKYAVDCLESLLNRSLHFEQYRANGEPHLELVVQTIWDAFRSIGSKSPELIQSVVEAVTLPLRFGVLCGLPSFFEAQSESSFKNVNVLRPLVSHLIETWRIDQETLVPFCDFIVNTLLQESLLNGTVDSLPMQFLKASHPHSTLSSPRFSMLTFFEKDLIPGAFGGNVKMKNFLHVASISLLYRCSSATADYLSKQEGEAVGRHRARTVNILQGKESNLMNEVADFKKHTQTFSDMLARCDSSSNRSGTFPSLESAVRFQENLGSERVLLNCWQAVSLLTVYFCSDDCSPELPLCLSSLIRESIQSALPTSVRYHIECTGGVLLLNCKGDMLRIAGEALEKYNLKSQTVSSFFIMLGYAAFADEKKRKGFVQSLIDGNFVAVMLPWLGAAHIFTRILAQSVVNFLLQKCRVTESSFRCIQKFLLENVEVTQMRRKQLLAFEESDLMQRCNVDHIASLYDCGIHKGSSHHSILNSIQSALNSMKLVSISQSSQRARDDKCNDDSIFQRKYNTKNEVSPNTAVHLEEAATSRATLPIIVCASLIQNPVNIGGLARTCEIMGVSTLLVSSILVIQKQEFSAVSMGASKWLHIDELPVSLLKNHIHKLKDRGYRIVALEQTGSSKSLANVSFPENTFLLIGEEKKGVPADLLHHCDACVQIPQTERIAHAALRAHLRAQPCADH